MSANFSLSAIAILISTTLIGWGVLKVMIGYFNKRELFDTPDQRKLHRIPTPSSGGLIFGIFSLFALPLFWNDNGYFSLLLCSIMLLIVGFIDDRKNLSARIKFFFQITAAVVTINAIGAIPLCNAELEWLNEIITFAFIIGFTNSFNLIDGLDGLAGSYAVMVLGVFTIGFWNLGNTNTVLYLIGLIGCIIGFLKENIISAKIFMGDTGSLFLGFLISVFTIQLSQEQLLLENYSWAQSDNIMLLLSLLLLPLIDTVRVIFVRINKGYSPFQPDRTHLHHILLKIGFSTKKIALFFVLTPLLLMLFSSILIIAKFTPLSIVLFLSSAVIALFNYIIQRRIKTHQINAIKYRKRLQHIIKKNQILSLYQIKQNTDKNRL